MVRKKTVVVIENNKVYLAVALLGILLASFIIFKYLPGAHFANSRSNDVLPTVEPNNTTKILLVKFHGNAQCQSCINLGEFAEETINNNFEQQKESGQILYRNINVEETPNDELVLKVQPTHASLYMIVNTNGKERFEELTQAWYYVSDQSAYEAYLTPIITRVLER